MQISKSLHLKHLLRTQDVLISALAYMVAVDSVWLLGIVHGTQLFDHLALLPLVVLFSILALRLESPGMHGSRMLTVAFLSARYAALIVTGILALAYFGKLEFVSRYAIGFYGFLLAAGLLSNRLFLRWWYFTGRREHPENFLQVIVIGRGRRANNLMRSYRENSEWGINVVGALDPAVGSSAETHLADDVPLLGDVSEIRKIFIDKVVDEVIICLPRSLLNDISVVIDACAEEGVCIKFLADLYEIEGGKYQLEQIGTWPVLSLDPISRNQYTLIIKRIADLGIAFSMLLLLFPLFLITALAIKIESRGSVFFTQPRVGLNKRQFKMIKFRSMYQDAEARLAELESLNEADGPIFKMKNDPRITRVGRFIRRSSIDELPQLLNVVLGHMSLVGPRPMSLRDVSLFSEGLQRKRFSVRPGLACLREVSGRSALSFEQWLALDLQYINTWSLWLDLKILLLLVPAVIKGDGAS